MILEGVVNGLPVIATADCGYASHVNAAKAGVVIPEPFDQRVFDAAIRGARDPAVGAAWSKAGREYGQRSGLSEGRWCAAQIILAAAQDKHPALADVAGRRPRPVRGRIPVRYFDAAAGAGQRLGRVFQRRAPGTAPG